MKNILTIIMLIGIWFCLIALISIDATITETSVILNTLTNV